VNHLFRELAPITSAGWAEIDTEAKRALHTFLAARRLVDFTGPLGWDKSCIGTGRVQTLSIEPVEGVTASPRAIQPLVELKTTFRLDRAELEAIDRGAADPDLGPVGAAARRLALAEDTLVLQGDAAVGVAGIVAASPQDSIEIGDDYSAFPNLVARAVSQLQDAGVGGPYAIALGPECYTGVIEGTERGGYPVLRHLELITGGPLVRAAALDGSLVVSLRGGDFELVVGQDISIGYRSSDESSVTLYLEETVTFRNLTPEAAVALRYPR
jgi:uncharacterized linocin/CFP29 family protein